MCVHAVHVCVCFIKEGERDPWVCACVVHVEHVQAKTLNYKIDPAAPISKTLSQLHEIETKHRKREKQRKGKREKRKRKKKKKNDIDNIFHQGKF